MSVQDSTIPPLPVRPEAEVTALIRGILLSHGCSPEVARIMAANCVRAEQDGSTSHGVFRVADYVSTLRSGWADGKAEPLIEDGVPGLVRVHARNGFAQVALEKVRPMAVKRVRALGTVLIAIRDSHHLGALALDVEPFAEEGLVAFSVVNSMAVVAAPGAHAPAYGTNPVAFAAPQARGAPLVMDLAASSMAHGDLRVHAAQGRPVPPLTGIDRDGAATTDAQAILEGGALLPFGGHKGAAIAMMVELLCAALVGGRFSHEVDWSGYPGARSARTGQTIIVIDPAAGAQGLASFPWRVSQMMDFAREAGQAHLPGDRRLKPRARAAAEGLPISEASWLALQELVRT
jgi:delta1-piperideine-2-carboxylate reductase